MKKYYNFNFILILIKKIYFLLLIKISKFYLHLVILKSGKIRIHI